MIHVPTRATGRHPCPVTYRHTFPRFSTIKRSGAMDIRIEIVQCSLSTVQKRTQTDTEKHDVFVLANGLVYILTRYDTLKHDNCPKLSKVPPFCPTTFRAANVHYGEPSRGGETTDFIEHANSALVGTITLPPEYGRFKMPGSGGNAFFRLRAP
jgi:hypothetical protein